MFDEKMRSELKKNIFHLAWSPDSLPACDAAAPLINFLDQVLSDLEPKLLSSAFQRVAVAVWEVVLFELWNQVQTSSGVSNSIPTSLPLQHRKSI